MLKHPNPSHSLASQTDRHAPSGRRQALRCTVVVLGLAWCALAAGPAQAFNFNFNMGGTEGSGKPKEESRPVGSFNRIRLDGAITVEARPAAITSLKVRADDNIVPLVTTTVEGDTLVVSTQRNASYSTRNPVVVEVGYTQLQAADLRGSGDLNIGAIEGDRFEAALSGSGDVRLAQVKVKRLRLSVAGSGDVRASGSTEELSVQVAGSGDVHAQQVMAQQAKVSVAGSGDARVQVRDNLDVSIAGSGDVWVTGKPSRINRSIVGSGDLHQTP